MRNGNEFGGWKGYKVQKILRFWGGRGRRVWATLIIVSRGTAVVVLGDWESVAVCFVRGVGGGIWVRELELGEILVRGKSWSFSN